MTETAEPSARSGLAPALGAAALAVFAIVLSVAILVWRGGAQRQVLDTETARCRKSDARACDMLRSQCVKRNGDACEALAESILGSTANRDTHDAMDLLGQACELRNRRACVTAARKLMAGDGVPKNAPLAVQLLDRGCELGEKEACALKETTP